jgi:hypothetical protein
MKALDLFAMSAAPESGARKFNTDAELEAAIQLELQRVISAPDVASAREPCSAMRALIAQRSAAQIKKMEKAKGLAR